MDFLSSTTLFVVMIGNAHMGKNQIKGNIPIKLDQPQKRDKEKSSGICHSMFNIDL